jgi:hypothetical protein
VGPTALLSRRDRRRSIMVPSARVASSPDAGPCLGVLLPLADADPLVTLDGRIRLAWSRRASCPRYSDAYWEADDDLAWLRMVRDELAWTGHLRDELRALIEVVAVAVEVEVPAGTAPLEATLAEPAPKGPLAGVA